MSQTQFEQEHRFPYAVEPKEPTSGRLLLAMAGLSIITPLLLVCSYLLATHTASPDLAPPTFGLGVLFFWLIRRAFRGYMDRLPEENESIMNFSSLGTLTCICEHAEPEDGTRAGRQERRNSCRTCGHAIVARNPERLAAPITSREISNLQSKLRMAAIKSKGRELPSSLEDVDQLLAHLKSAPPAPPSDPTTKSRAKQFA